MIDRDNGGYSNEELTNVQWDDSPFYARHTDILGPRMPTYMVSIPEKITSEEIAYHPPVQLLQDLASSEWQIRIHAIRELELLGKQAPLSVVYALEGALQDSSKFVRAAAAQSLGEVGGKAQKTVLLLTLPDREWNVRAAVIQALGTLGADTPVATIVKALSDTHEMVRETAIWTLMRLGSDILLQPLKSEEAITEELSLSAGGDVTPFHALLSVLEDRCELVRSTAVEALSELGEHAPIELLARALRDPHEFVRAAGAKALGKFGKRIPMEILTRSLLDNHEIVRATVVKTLGELGEQAPIERIILMLKDSSEIVRSEAITTLGKLYTFICEHVSFEFLLYALKDEDENIRAIATWILGERGEIASIELLVRASRDNSEIVRTAAEWAVTHLEELYDSVSQEAQAMTVDPVNDSTYENVVKTFEHPEEVVSKEALLISLLKFIEEKKGYVAVESGENDTVILNFYYEKEERSVQEAVLRPYTFSSHIERFENAFSDTSAAIRATAQRVDKKLQRHDWSETFMISLDVSSEEKKQLEKYMPKKVILCSIGYSEMRSDAIPIHQDIEHNCSLKGSRRLDQHTRALVETAYEHVQEYQEMKLWYKSAANYTPSAGFNSLYEQLSY